MSEHHEIERTFGPVPPDLPLPGLVGLAGVAELGEAQESLLEATYVDTADLRLVRAGITLRRRTGGADEGWHLKLPAGEGRDEVHAPLGRRADHVPVALRRLVLARTRGAELAPVATVVTRRTTTDLLDDQGRRLAEVADDRVEGRAAGEGGTDRQSAWREWEVELVDGDPALLDAVEEHLRASGVARSPVQRKVVQVLGERADPPEAPPRPTWTGPASQVLHARLATLVDTLQRQDVAIRRGDPEGVHRARIACRRMRTALATFRPLVEREVTDPLRDELRWLGRELAPARDAQVAGDHLLQRLDEQPREALVGPVRQRVRRELDSDAKDGLRAARTALESERYLALVDRLVQLASAPPWTAAAHRRARKRLPRRVHKDVTRLLDRLAAAEAATGDGRDEAWHSARKAAKRLRYTAEALEPAAGKPARRLRKAAKQVTTALGARQDTVVAREQLVRLAALAREDGESDFTYGLLVGQEQARAAEAERDALGARGRVEKRRDDWG